MTTKGHFTGMTGVYLVAAGLSRRRFLVSPTSRNANTADLLVTDAECRNTYAIQVKTNAATFDYWLVNSKTSRIVSDKLVYAFVNLREAGPEFFLVPSAVVAQRVAISESPKTTWYSVALKDIAAFRDNWSFFKKNDEGPGGV